MLDFNIKTEVRGGIIALGISLVVISLLILMLPPENTAANLGKVAYFIRGVAIMFIFLGCLLTVGPAQRLRKVGWYGITLICLSLGVSVALQRATGASMGTTGWISSFVSTLFLIPIGILLCGITGIASLHLILKETPNSNRLVGGAIIIPLILLALFYLAAGRQPDIRTSLAIFDDPDRQDEYFSAASRLADINDPELLAPLITLLDHQNPQLRAATAMALSGKSHHERAISPLLVALAKESDPEAKIWMIRALGVASHNTEPSQMANTIEMLIEKLQNDDILTKQAAAEALGFMKAEKAIKPLIDSMAIEDVHFLAHNALIIITGQRLGPDPELWNSWWQETHPGPDNSE
ncbi:MAG: HEAT repeat domain-containing protein [Proteobacteria bacterium]|nr:HEAT repeat domain-containing protein [Pseudomonadota bacterium]MBU1686779.1 HEAT repeat domain-containing protein [Pseudomonadota bacterium]